MNVCIWPFLSPTNLNNYTQTPSIYNATDGLAQIYIYVKGTTCVGTAKQRYRETQKEHNEKCIEGCDDERKQTGCNDTREPRVGAEMDEYKNVIFSSK